MKYIVIVLLFIFSSPANAGFHIGTSIMILGSDDTTRSYNGGYSWFFENGYVFDLTTNLPYPTESKFNKGGFKVKSKVTYIAGSIGYKLSRRTILSVFGTLVKVDNSIYYHNINIKNYDNKAVVFGGNATYFLYKNVAGSVFCVLRNTNIDSRSMCGLGANLYF